MGVKCYRCLLFNKALQENLLIKITQHEMQPGVRYVNVVHKKIGLFI